MDTPRRYTDSMADNRSGARPGYIDDKSGFERRLARIDRKLGEDMGRRAGIDPPIQLLLEPAPGD